MYAPFSAPERSRDVEIVLTACVKRTLPVISETDTVTLLRDVVPKSNRKTPLLGFGLTVKISEAKLFSEAVA